MLFKNITKDLSIKIPNTIPPILTDNTTAIKLVENPEFYKRSKYIRLAYYYTRTSIREGEIKVFYIKLKDNIANIFIKELRPRLLYKFKDGLSLV